MAKIKRFSRASSLFFISLGEHFAKFKWCYIVLGAISLSAVVVGFITGFKQADSMTLVDIPDVTLVKFIEKEITAFSVFFSRIFAVLGLFLLVWISNCKPWLSVITFILLIYRAFLLGITCSMLIVLYKMGGIINVVLIFFPFHLLVLFALMGWCAVCLQTNLSCKTTGISVLNYEFWRYNKSCLFGFLILVLLSYLMEAILIPYITSAVFIGIS